MAADRQQYYPPEELLTEVKEKITNADRNNESIDDLTIVPDGEPTLNKNFGKLICLLKPLGFKIAVISNSTLLDDAGVRQDLNMADWVSVKIDALDERIWKRIDRPHKKIGFGSMLKGIKTFSREYKGMLATETMLIKNRNDDIENIKKVA